MKYVFAALAIVAAVAALFFRPPHGDSLAPVRADEGAQVSASSQASPFAQQHAPRLPAPAPRQVVVYVAGEVVKPGVYALAPEGRAQDALARAGGPKSDADLVAVNLAAPLADGEELAVPKIGAQTPRVRRAAVPRKRSMHAPRGHGRRRRPTPTGQRPAAESVDLNSADENELETLPGIGPGLAARIVAYREMNGPFASVDELADISGITPKLQDELATLVVVR